jgi:hypothetical protein
VLLGLGAPGHPRDRGDELLVGDRLEIERQEPSHSVNTGRRV